MLVTRAWPGKCIFFMLLTRSWPGTCCPTRLARVQHGAEAFFLRIYAHDKVENGAEALFSFLHAVQEFRMALRLLASSQFWPLNLLQLTKLRGPQKN